MHDKEFPAAVWSRTPINKHDISNCVQGVVTFHRSSGLSLDIPLGSLFGSRGIVSATEPYTAECIYGFSQTGKYLTLLGVSASDPGFHSRGFEHQTVLGQALVVSHAQIQPNPLVSSISARMPGLREWVGKSACTTVHELGDKTTGRESLEFKFDAELAKDITLFESGDVTITATYCGWSAGGPIPSYEFRYTEDYRLDIKFSSPVPLDEAFDKWLIGTWDFLSLCMGFRGSLESMSFVDSKSSKPCEYYRPLVENKENPTDSMLRKMPFTYPHIGNKTQSLISKWLNLDGYLADGAIRTVGLLNDWDAPIDLLFLASAQALEALAHVDAYKSEEHRSRFSTKNHEKKLLDKIEPLTSSLIPNRGRFLEYHHSNRNGYTHLERAKQTLKGEDLYWHTKTVQLIDYVATMMVLGLTPEEIQKALEESHYRETIRFEARQMYSKE